MRKKNGKTLQSLKELAENYNSIISLIPCHIYWKDKDGKYLGCNLLQAKNLGLSSPEEIIGKTDYDLPWHDQAAELQASDKQVMRTKKDYTVEEEVIFSHDKKSFFLSKKAVLLTENGSVKGIIGISFDITDRKRMEEELQKAKEAAEAANQAKSEFLANMSHDIRTPLTGVIGMSELLESTLQDTVEKENARMIHDSGQELLGMLNGILDDVRAGNVSEMDIKEEEFDLYGCIQDLVKLELPTTKMKGLQLEVSIDEDVPRFIVSDRKKIHRVLLNLIGNAIKFTKLGGIVITVKCLEKIKDRVHLEFGIADTGIGIPKDKQDKVFDRFFRVSPSYKGLYAGHGLGLHIAQSYVNLLGGQIGLTSDEGVGTTFHFDLECAIGGGKSISTELIEGAPNSLPSRSQYPHPTVATSDSLTKNAPHVLLIEDNPIALKVLESIVARAGCRFTSAQSGEQALAFVKSMDLDFIVTDIGLPGISGKELVSQIRDFEKENLKKHIPIIGLTGHARETALDECLAAGMEDVFTKPINLSILKRIINNYLRPNELKGNTTIDLPPESEIAAIDLPDTEEKLLNLDSFPIFDPKYGLQQINNLSLLFDVWKTLISDEMQNEFHLLEKAYEEKDWPKIERLAHKIKGSACYGTCRLFYACQYFELYYKAGHKSLLNQLYHQMLSVNQETIVTLTDWLHKYTQK